MSKEETVRYTVSKKSSTVHMYVFYNVQYTVG